INTSSPSDRPESIATLRPSEIPASTCATSVEPSGRTLVTADLPSISTSAASGTVRTFSALATTMSIVTDSPGRREGAVAGSATTCPGAGEEAGPAEPGREKRPPGAAGNGEAASISISTGYTAEPLVELGTQPMDVTRPKRRDPGIESTARTA